MKTIIGLYEDMATANQVIQTLVSEGIGRNEISLVTSDRAGAYASAGTRDTGDSDPTIDTGSATAGGAVTGAVLGGLGGALLSLGALAIPGIGPIIAAGPLIAGLIGAGAGAAVGGLVGTLTEAGIPEEEAAYYIEAVKRGGTLVSVQANDNNAAHVVDLMNRYSPIDVKERASSWRSEEQPDYGDSLSTDVSGRMDEESSRFATQTLAGQVATNDAEPQYDPVLTNRTVNR